MRKYFFKKSFSGLLVCIFIVLLFFLPNIVKGKIPIPADSLLGLYHPFRDISVDSYNPGKFPVKNPLITDPILQTYPWRSAVIKSVKSFNFPFWNPYSFAGQPLLGNVQSSTFSAFNIFFLILPFNFAWGAQIIFSSILTAIFMYLFLRNLTYEGKNLSILSSILGSITLTFCGFFIAWLEWGTITTTAMWLPLILLSTSKLKSKKSSLWFLLLVFSIIQVLVAGHLQTALYVILTFILYVIYLFISEKKPAIVILCAIALFFSLIISSPQLIPSMDFINNSARSSDQGYYPNRLDWFLPPQNLIQLVVPDFFGNPATYNYWGIWNYAEFVSFIGVIPFFFIVLFFTTGKKKDALFFTLLLAISLIFGLQNFVSKVPYEFKFPFLSSLQPSRILFLSEFSLAVLCAFGVNVYQKSQKKYKPALFSALLTILLVFCIAISPLVIGNIFPKGAIVNPQSIAVKNSVIPLAIAAVVLGIILFQPILKIKKRYVLILLIIIASADFFRFAYKFTPFSKPSWIFPQTKIISYLNDQKQPFRIMTMDRRIMHPNSSTYYAVESIDGYDPLYLKNYGQFVASWQGSKYENIVPSFNRIITPQKLDSPIINLLNVKYVLSFDEIKQPGFNLVLQEGDTKLYQNDNSLPRVYFVGRIVLANNKDAFANMIDPAADPKSKAFSSSTSYTSATGSAQAKISKYTPNQIRIQTRTTVDKPLFISNNNDSGWSATIDSKPTVILPVDIIFQSVIVPKGKHTVELKYEPRNFRTSLILAIFGALAAISVSLLLWRKKFQ